MSKKFTFVAFGLLALISAWHCRAQSEASQEAGLESSIRLEVYRAMYAGHGPRGVLPKAFVFGKDGTCVGLLTKPGVDAGDLWSAIDESIAANRKACELTYSSEFPDQSTQPRRARVENARVVLVVIREDFCVACEEYTQALRQGSASRPTVDVAIYRVELPQDDPASPGEQCPTCSKND